MIELPRAHRWTDCRGRGFFSFGTNDLTQTTCGASPATMWKRPSSPRTERGIFGVSPFESLDRDGAGRLVGRPAEKVGKPGQTSSWACAVNTAIPTRFFHQVGLDYVSCSPFRVPVARLEAAPLSSPRAATAGDDKRHPLGSRADRPSPTQSQRLGRPPGRVRRPHRAAIRGYRCRAHLVDSARRRPSTVRCNCGARSEPAGRDPVDLPQSAESRSRSVRAGRRAAHYHYRRQATRRPVHRR